MLVLCLEQMTVLGPRFEQHCFQHPKLKQKKAHCHHLHRHRRHKLPVQQGVVHSRRAWIRPQLVSVAAAAAWVGGEVVAGGSQSLNMLQVGCQDEAEVAAGSSACRASEAGAAEPEFAVVAAGAEPSSDAE